MTEPFIAVPSYMRANAEPAAESAGQFDAAARGVPHEPSVHPTPRFVPDFDDYLVPDFVPAQLPRHPLSPSFEDVRLQCEASSLPDMTAEDRPSGFGGEELGGAELGRTELGRTELDRAAAMQATQRDDLDSLGPLAPYAEQAGVTDLFVNGDAGLWLDRGHGAERVSGWNLDEAEVRELAVRLIARGGRHIDEATPCVDVRLGDGIRVHAVLPPISSTGTLLSIRLPSAAGFDLAGLRRSGLFGDEVAASALHDRLERAVDGRENILVTGAAGSGKTTLLAALLGRAAPGERIVTLEDVAELRIRHPHVVSLEARQANLEGAGRLGLEALVREALRMRPDRLVLGECRGAEIREMLAALNTGHDGGAGTLHANSLADVPARLEALGALAGMSPEAIARQTVSAIGLVLHIERRAGIRRLGAPGRFALDSNGRLAVRPETEA